MGKNTLKARQLQYNRLSEKVNIIETDKSKQLVALDAHIYTDMVNKSTIESGNYHPIEKLNQPRTEQINFNKQLNKIIKCIVYHKDGKLKGRPIHAASATLPTSPSKYI